MEIISSIIRQWKAETPIFAKYIRNIAGVIATAAPAAWASFSLMGISLPEWFTSYVGLITFVAILITAIAGTKEVKK